MDSQEIIKDINNKIINFQQTIMVQISNFFLMEFHKMLTEILNLEVMEQM